MTATETRHRLITSTSRGALIAELTRLSEEGWRPIGDPALATPLNEQRPPYWSQAMYFSATPIVLETISPVALPGAAECCR